MVINFKGCPIIWKSKRQALVALSTAESELIAACEAVTVALSAEALIADIAQALGRDASNGRQHRRNLSCGRKWYAAYPSLEGEIQLH